MVDAFSSGSGLADKKHFTVDVEHQFTTPPTSPFIEYIYFFPFVFDFHISVHAHRTAPSTQTACRVKLPARWRRCSRRPALWPRAPGFKSSRAPGLRGPRAPGFLGFGLIDSEVPGLQAYRLWGPRAPGFAPSCSSTTAHRRRFCLT